MLNSKIYLMTKPYFYVQRHILAKAKKKKPATGLVGSYSMHTKN